MCSSANILLNKRVLSGSYGFTAVNALLAYHCAIAAALLRGAAALGVVEVAPLTKEVFLVWAPLNVVFVGMLATALKALGLVRVDGGVVWGG